MILRVLILTFFIKMSLFSCGGDWDYNQKDFIFLQKRALPFENISEEVNSANIYNIIIGNYEEKNKQENLKEWEKELKNSYSLKEIEEFVYDKKNLDKLKEKDFVDYINFVAEQEDYVTYNYYEEKKELNNYSFLIKNALDKIETVNSSWLKLRYFYLALRIAHYKKQEPLKIYDKYKYLLENENKTIVKDWIQGLYAGALIKSNQTVKGVYEFSKLLDNDKINWHLSYYNFFHIKTQKQWEELLSLAKSPEEKTKFHALRALNENSNILEELKNIYALDKNSKWFDFVLYRELLNSQHFFDQDSLYERNFVFKNYIEFLKTVNKEDMYLVNLALAYFNLYENNLEEASKITQNLLSKNPNSHEVQTLSYIIYLNQLEKIDLKTENSIYEKMTNLMKEEETSSSIHDYTFVILEKLYLKQNDKLNAFLANHINYLDEAVFDLALLEKFKLFMETSKDSKIKEHFASKYLQQDKIKKQDDRYVLNENLITTKTKLLINNLRFEEALKLNSSILNEKIQFNPFNGLIRGNNRSGKQDMMTIKEFLEKIIVIQKELEKNPKSPMDNYLYANALYNLSYFGNSNILTTVYRSVYSFTDKDLQQQKMDLATKHFSIAFDESQDKEFKAKIAYMLAKVEISNYDINFASSSQDYYNKDMTRYDLERYGYGNEETYNKYLKNNYGKYFALLKKDFNDTKYYKELIKECANLRVYEKHLKQPKPAIR